MPKNTTEGVTLNVKGFTVKVGMDNLTVPEVDTLASLLRRIGAVPPLIRSQMLLSLLELSKKDTGGK